MFNKDIIKKHLNTKEQRYFSQQELGQTIEEFVANRRQGKYRSKKIDVIYEKLVHLLENVEPIIENNHILNLKENNIDLSPKAKDAYERLSNIKNKSIITILNQYLSSVIINDKDRALSDYIVMNDDDFSSLSGIGRKRLLYLNLFREDLIKNPDKYIRESQKYNILNNSIVISSDKVSITEKISDVFHKLIKNLELINQQQADIVNAIFFENKTREELATYYNLSQERICQLYMRQLLMPLLSGKKYETISFSEDFLNDICKFKKDMLYSPVGPEESVKHISNILDVLRIKVGNSECPFYINEHDKLKVIRDSFFYTCKVLGELIVPEPKGLIMLRIKEMANKNSKQINETFVNCLFEKDNNWVENIGEDLYQMRIEYLDSIYQRLGRIIYDKKDWISKDEIEARYNKIFHDSPIIKGINLLTLLKSKNPNFISSGKKGIWRYSKGGEDKDPQTIISKYIRNLGEQTFTFNDITELLAETGCPSYSCDCIRAYITNEAVRHNGNRELFCGKLTQISKSKCWRSPAKYRFQKVLLKKAIDILRDDNNLDLQSLTDKLAYYMKDTEFKLSRIKEVLKLYISSDDANPNIFSCIENTDTVILNKDYLDTINIDSIGVKSKSKPFYTIVYSYTVNELKKAKDNRVLLSDLANKCIANLDIPTRSYQGITKILQHIDAPKIINIEKLEGRLYVSLKEEEENEETYIIQEIDSNKPKTEEPVPVRDERIRENISYNTEVNWDNMLKFMKGELSYYRDWFGELDYDSAIQNLKNYLINSDCHNLKEIIPLDIYQFWFGKIGIYDKYTYLGDLVRCYERLLQDILAKKGLPHNFNGIWDTVSNSSLFQDFFQTFRNRECRMNFGRVFYSLHIYRNKYAHGEDIELSNVSFVTTITSFIALYVYTIQKYFYEC